MSKLNGKRKRYSIENFVVSKKRPLRPDSARKKSETEAVRKKNERLQRLEMELALSMLKEMYDKASPEGKRKILQDLRDLLRKIEEDRLLARTAVSST